MAISTQLSLDSVDIVDQLHTQREMVKECVECGLGVTKKKEERREKPCVGCVGGGVFD